MSSSAGRRQQRAEGGRSKSVLVRLTAEQHEQIAAAAASVGMSRPAYLSWRGVQPLESSGTANPVKLRAWVAELYALKRILRGSATNLNQLTKLANTTGEVPQESWHHGERIARMEERVTALLESIGPELVPRGDDE